MRPMRGPIRYAILCAVFCLAVTALWGCQSKPAVPDSRLEEMTIERVAVLPLRDMYAIYGEGVSFRCPFCGRSFIISQVAPDADTFLTAQLYTLLQGRESFQVIPPDQADGVQSRLLFNNAGGLADPSVIQQIGKELEADAVVIGRVYKFVERTGTRFAAESPASVSFNLLLISTSDGALLWEGQFTETQRSLSENLLKIGTFFKRKMSWLTAEQLAVSGLEETLQSFPLQ